MNPLPTDAPIQFTPHQVAVIEAALINARLKMDLTDGAQVVLGKEAEGDRPTTLNNRFERDQLNEALRILGYDIGQAFDVPAPHGLPQKR